ncbi:MAG: 30S ribosomal protein S5 [Candidatus Aenigmarchaeota archaeon]|nr:30S ribosomal protein S5 [Candidatus Aenigmarchaeota archaeon]
MEKGKEAVIESVATPAETVETAAVVAEPVIPPEAAKEEITPEEVKNLLPSLDGWKPVTKLGKEVMENKWDLKSILEAGIKIKEFQIVDKLMPELGHEIIYIGGSPGKGGGSQRTITKKTARMHKSGRRFRISSLVVVGNGDGIIGVGQGTGKEHRNAIEKAVEHAKLNMVFIKRGCGSWQCACGQPHSLPLRGVGRAGSVKVELKPAPRGTGLAVSDDLKKILKAAGVKDAWCRTSGNTSARTNLIKAGFNALKSMNNMKQPNFLEKSLIKNADQNLERSLIKNTDQNLEKTVDQKISEKSE